MDALIIKSLPLDLPNFLGRESWEKSFLAAGVLRFQRNHPILQEFLYYMRDKFDGDDWGANGPKLGTSMYYYMACNCTMYNSLLLGKSHFF